ncbi:ATP-binding protein [Bacteroides fluxus]|uniref:ATP-binding protein n=1 Tax=Bacteroides fluxus TaxID=626930 RepID=UPI002356CBFB|nr:ATP-binding protein [Bacteroides fluxus]
MSKFKENIPQADMLMGSMRSMGYSFEAAIADVIDNSISAQCSFVKLLFPTTYTDSKAIGVLDDGVGMNAETLFEAMRYGSSDSSEERDENDLGRFGLGMKSASMSQCRILTVVSKQDNVYCCYTWDYNIICEQKRWIVIEHTLKEIEALPYIEELKSIETGTLVIWQDFDIIEKSNDGRVFDFLNDQKDILDKYLGLIYHRFLSDAKKSKLKIYINNGRVKPLDPFLESHSKTTSKKERTIEINDSNGVERLITIKPFILPYATDLSDKDKQLVGGIENLRSKQGFYIYRNRRLIIWGTWFGMKPRAELTKNARIRVDIPNTLDDIWGINIMKQKAIIPKSIQHRMKKTVLEAMEISVAKQTHRGRRENIENLDYIWDRMEGRNKTYFYQINRDNKVFKMIREKMSDEDFIYLDMLISEIEKNIPIDQMYIDKSNEAIFVEEGSDRFDEVFQLGITMVDLIKETRPFAEIIEDLMKSEPFCRYQKVQTALLKHYENEPN